MIIFAYYSRVIFISFYLVALHLSWICNGVRAFLICSTYVLCVCMSVYCSIRRQADSRSCIGFVCIVFVLLLLLFAVVYSAKYLYWVMCVVRLSFYSVLSFLVCFVFVYRTEHGMTFTHTWAHIRSDPAQYVILVYISHTCYMRCAILSSEYTALFMRVCLYAHTDSDGQTTSFKFSVLMLRVAFGMYCISQRHLTTPFTLRWNSYWLCERNKFHSKERLQNINAPHKITWVGSPAFILFVRTFA